jgi:hypothetical protein
VTWLTERPIRDHEVWEFQVRGWFEIQSR